MRLYLSERLSLSLVTLSIILSAPTISLSQPAQVSKLIPRGVRWERIYTKQGITIMRAERADSDLPLLKGQGTLNINLYDLMAVVEDAPRHVQWVPRMEVSEIFERPDSFHLKCYVQFNFPWPASDRDSVLQIEVIRVWAPQHEVWISFQRAEDPRYPVRSGVVRVPRSRGYTRLRWISPKRTEVMYVIDSDPGGHLPRWLVRWLSQDLPFKVIKALERQVSGTQGRYNAFLKRWDPRRSPQRDAPLQFTLPGVRR